jgi:antitoxin VapB
MALNIESDTADRLARELSDLTGESLTEVVVVSLEQRLTVERRRLRPRPVDDLVDRFQRCASGDPRRVDEIIGYDQHGLSR